MFKRNSILLAALAAAFAPLAASAATLCVNPGGTAGCAASIGEAMNYVDYNNDVINVAAGTYFENGLYIGLPVQIRGAGMDVTIIDGMVAGANGPQVFRYDFWGSSGDSSLSGLTIRHGRRGVDAGRFNRITLDHVRVTANGPESGAGIINNASQLTVRNSLIDHNFATDNGSVNGCDWGGGSGGGIATLCGGGSLELHDSAIVDNVASRWGGGLMLNGGASVIENSTISGNQANFPDAGLAGGGIFAGAPTLVRFSTIANNSAVGAGGVWVGTELRLYASLLQGNSGNACTGISTSLGYNIVSDASCNFAATGDVNGTDAMLAPLAMNGGPTPTHELGMASAAFDHVPTVDCTVFEDQRGISRPQHGACDVGAVEHVPTAAELVQVLAQDVVGVGPGGSLAAKVASVLASISSGDTGTACSKLSALRNEVNAQSGKKISAAQAAALLAAIAEVAATMHC